MRPVPSLPSLRGPGRLEAARRALVRRVVAALLAGLSVAAAVSAVTSEPEPLPRRDVVVAARALPGGRVLDAASLTVVAMVAEAVPPGAYAASAPLLGRLTSAPVAAGEALTRTRVVQRGPGDGLPAGQVAIQVRACDPADLALLDAGRVVRVHASDGSVLASRLRVLAVRSPGADQSGTEGLADPGSAVGGGLGGGVSGGVASSGGDAAALVLAVPDDAVAALVAPATTAAGDAGLGLAGCVRAFALPTSTASG